MVSSRTTPNMWPASGFPSPSSHVGMQLREGTWKIRNPPGGAIFLVRCHGDVGERVKPIPSQKRFPQLGCPFSDPPAKSLTFSGLNGNYH